MRRRNAQSATTAAAFRNRIVGHDDVDPVTLEPNALNWRKHPKSQRAALLEVLDEVGWIDQVIVNRRTGRLIDGHLRVETAIERKEATVPVTYVDLSDDEERLILATFDSITGLAGSDDNTITDLLKQLGDADGAIGRLVQDSSTAISALLESLAPKEAPSSELLGVANITVDDPQHKVAPGDVYRIDDRHYLVCVDVLTQHDKWLGVMQSALASSDDVIFAPFPGPFIPFTKQAQGRVLVMVQPDPYICGHILDRWAEQYKASDIEKV